MTLRRELVVVDGRPTWHYSSDKPVVVVGPLQGQVVTESGHIFDVSPDVIEVESEELAKELAHHIALRYAEEGHPDHTDGTPFVHECNANCPKGSRKAAKG